LFYEFHLGDAVPEEHLVRKIDAALDLSWLRSELAPHYSSTGRPSIDPELMIRMLVVGYVFAIRSERLICREVQVNLAYRWFCKLGIEDAIPDHSAFSRARNERFREGDVFRHMFERVVEACIAAGLVGGDGFAVDASLIQADANKRRSIAAQDWRKDRDPQRSSRAVKEYLPRRYGVGRRQRRCAEVRLPIRSRGAPELTRNRHSSRTPTIISST
jgi:transposase